MGNFFSWCSEKKEKLKKIEGEVLEIINDFDQLQKDVKDIIVNQTGDIVFEEKTQRNEDQ